MKYKTLSEETGLSLSTIYRRIRKGYTTEQIKEEAKIMRKYDSAGSNWEKVAKKEEKELPNHNTPNLPELDLDATKEPKRVLYWEPADDYGLVNRLKVLGGWIIKVETEVLFVLDPKHRWEV